MTKPYGEFNNNTLVMQLLKTVGLFCCAVFYVFFLTFSLSFIVPDEAIRKFIIRNAEIFFYASIPLVLIANISNTLITWAIEDIIPFWVHSISQILSSIIVVLSIMGIFYFTYRWLFGNPKFVGPLMLLLSIMPQIYMIYFYKKLFEHRRRQNH